jgi:hypothetical protein
MQLSTAALKPNQELRQPKRNPNASNPFWAFLIPGKEREREREREREMQKKLTMETKSAAWTYRS